MKTLALFFMERMLKRLKKTLNGNFDNICRCFVDNNLSIHSGEYRTKLILISSTHEIKKALKLNVK